MIRVGIIGLGFIGTTVGPDIDAAEGAEVVALADVNPDILREGGELLDVPTSSQYESYLEMFDAEALDGVLIATPHTLHYEQVCEALDREIHVLCEKPLTTDVERARDLVARAEASPVTLTVGYQRRVDPAYVRARELVADELADVKFVTASITQDWIAHQRGKWRADPGLSGGGQLYDTGSHLVDIVLWMTDVTPTGVSAEMVFDDPEERVDIQASLNVKTAEGTLLSIAVSGDATDTMEHIHMWGDEGAVYVTGERWGAREVDTIGLRPEHGETHSLQSKGAAFVETIRDGRPPIATARDALTVTALTAAAYEAATTGTRVEVDLAEAVAPR